LLLPGLACDDALWADQAAALRDAGFDPVISDAHTRHTTLPEMAQALLAAHSGRLVLVGASMGGMVALAMQRQAPERVAAMALLGTSARPDTPELVALRTQACAMFAAGRMDEVLRANVAFAFHPDNARDSQQVAAYLRMVRRAGAAQLIAQNQAVMARPDSRPLLAAVRCPVLVLCGEADQLTPPEHAREIAQGIPGAELHLLAGAGHMLTLEQPQPVAQHLVAWLRKVPLSV